MGCQGFVAPDSEGHTGCVRFPVSKDEGSSMAREGARRGQAQALGPGPGEPLPAANLGVLGAWPPALPTHAATTLMTDQPHC